MQLNQKRGRIFANSFYLSANPITLSQEEYDTMSEEIQRIYEDVRNEKCTDATNTILPALDIPSIFG
jgi:hypothetical protein